MTTTATILLGKAPAPLDIGVIRVTEKSNFSKALDAQQTSITLDELQIHVLETEVSEMWDAAALAHLIKYCSDKASINVHILECSDKKSDGSITTAFLLADLAIQSEKTMTANSSTNTRILTAIKKTRNISTVTGQKISLNNKVRIDLDDDDDDDLINEDDLLDDIVAPKKEVDPSNKDDCGGRMPCDDCTCGRKEALENGTGGGEMKQTDAPYKSNCGNCALGDAFRCASCPYLGKPAFKAGKEHLVLDLADDL